jgi:hypothetical protein
MCHINMKCDCNKSDQQSQTGVSADLVQRELKY